MPHTVIEYTAPLAEEFFSADVVGVVHESLLSSGLFEAAHICTRALCVDDFLLGELGDTANFIHITLSLLEGRPAEQKSALANGIINTVKEILPEVSSISVDIREMTRATYRKIIIPKGGSHG